MIDKCKREDFNEIYEIINDASIAYKGIIPADRWHEPYMPKEELEKQIGERRLNFTNTPKMKGF